MEKKHLHFTNNRSVGSIGACELGCRNHLSPLPVENVTLWKRYLRLFYVGGWLKFHCCAHVSPQLHQHRRPNGVPMLPDDKEVRSHFLLFVCYFYFPFLYVLVATLVYPTSRRACGYGSAVFHQNQHLSESVVRSYGSSVRKCVSMCPGHHVHCPRPADRNTGPSQRSLGISTQLHFPQSTKE